MNILKVDNKVNYFQGICNYVLRKNISEIFEKYQKPAKFKKNYFTMDRDDLKV